MENIKLNETPVRTSKNFNINNIKLENIEVPDIMPKFPNTTILNPNESIEIQEKQLDFNLQYGLSTELTNLVRTKANKNLVILSRGKENSEAQVIFDFDSVTFMDSAGIGLIIGRYKFANMLGGKLEVANLTQSVRKIFEMSGILKLIPVTEL